MFLNDHSKVCGKGRGMTFVSFPFYCFSLKFNNTALLGGFFLANRPYENFLAVTNKLRTDLTTLERYLAVIYLLQL